MADLRSLRRVLAQTGRRLRAQRAADALSWVLLAGATTSGLLALLTRGVGGAWSTDALWIACAAASCAALGAALWPLDVRRAARALDRAHRLPDSTLSALEFSLAAERTPFMEAHLRSAEALAPTLSARSAAPWRIPRALRLAPLALLAWGAALLWPSPDQGSQTPTAAARVSHTPLLSRDDLGAFRDELHAMAAHPELTPEAAAEVRAYNALLERLATGELSRAEALRALLSLEHKLLEDASGAARDAGVFAELADDLASAREAIAQALRRDDPRAAAEALRSLGSDVERLSASERARLVEALARVRERAAREAAQGEPPSLLQKREAAAAQPPGERSLFERERKRELDRLRREHAAQAERRRQLERLTRPLGQSGDALARGDVGEAQRKFEQAARELERFADQRRTGEQRRKLAQQLAQLRELLQRSQPQGGSQGSPQGSQGSQGSRTPQADAQRSQRMQRFTLRAQGKSEEEAQAALALRPGEAGAGGGSPSQQQPPEQPGQGEAQGTPGEQEQGARGQGTTQASRLLVPGGEGGERVELLLPGQLSQRSLSSEAGTEHDPRRLSTPTELKASHQDSQLRGVHGRGPTRSQVILDAADRGFVTHGYEKVYADYRAHAEAVLERDEIPAGYRFYVRRYFQLIRPRDAQGAAP